MTGGRQHDRVRKGSRAKLESIATTTSVDFGIQARKHRLVAEQSVDVRLLSLIWANPCPHALPTRHSPTPNVALASDNTRLACKSPSYKVDKARQDSRCHHRSPFTSADDDPNRDAANTEVFGRGSAPAKHEGSRLRCVSDLRSRRREAQGHGADVGSRQEARTKRSKLVFAPTKYVEPELLHRYRITFQQLPFQIYEAVGQSGTG